MRKLYGLMAVLMLATLGCQHVAAPVAADRSLKVSQLLLAPKLNELKSKNIQLDGEPIVGATEFGHSVFFDGNDRLQMTENGLLNAEAFTVEAVIYVNNVYPAHSQPRFLHIESDDGHHRVTLELRLNDRQQWYFDGYLKSPAGQLTLIDEAFIHPVDQWFHVAVTYQNGLFTSYVNGQQELQKIVAFTPMRGTAQMSLGARLNRVHWFSGALDTVVITPKALAPKDFNDGALVL